LRCLKSIAYILLFSFSVLFVGKTSSVKSAFSEIEKQLDDIGKNVDVEDGFEKIDENNIEKDDFHLPEIRNGSNPIYGSLCLTFNKLFQKSPIPLVSAFIVLQPIIAVFTPPPNSK
jgi:hypothetical protein